MSKAKGTPHLLEPQSEYTPQDVTRGLALAWEAETVSCTKTSVVDVFVAVLCPCVSVAQVASSSGLSYFATLMEFAVLYLLRLVNLALKNYNSNGHDVVEVVGDFLFHELLVYFCGPVFITILGLIYFINISTGEGGDYPLGWLAYVVCDIVFALAAQLVRNKFRRRVGLPRDGFVRILFNTTCCIWYNLAATTSSAKKYNTVSSCHVGRLDTIPAFEPHEHQTHSAA